MILKMSLVESNVGKRNKVYNSKQLLFNRSVLCITVEDLLLFCEQRKKFIGLHYSCPKLLKNTYKAS